MSNSSVCNIWAKVPKSLQDLQLNEREREFQRAGVLTLNALADNANDMRGTGSNSLSADLRRNKSPLRISGKVAVGIVRDTRKFSWHPYIGRIARSALR